jgi:hypothetical protein
MKGLYFEVNGQTYDVQIYWNHERYDYVNYRSIPRGFYMSVKPVKLSSKNGILIKQFGAFTGYRRLIEERTRYSKKTLEEHAEHYLNPDNPQVKELIAAIEVKDVQEGNLPRVSDNRL